MLAMFQATAEKCGYSKDRVSATPQNDILKEMIARGAWIFLVKPAVPLIGDTIEYSLKELSRTNPVSACGYHIRESGCSPSQEIAYAFQIANTYIDEVLSRGYGIDDFAKGLTFNFTVFGNLWEQVAKFRAARKLWAKNVSERYGAKDRRSLLFHGLFGGGGYGMTKAQPENNIIRGAYYALAAALDGAQTTALCSFDEAYTIPTPRAALLSLRMFQILMDELGGIIKAVESGYVQRQVAKQAYEFEKGVQKGELIKVGVNKYVEGDEMEVDLHEYRWKSVEEQLERLQHVKRERDNRRVSQLLRKLEQDAREQKNVNAFAFGML